MRLLLAIADEVGAQAITRYISEQLVPGDNTEITILSVAEELPLDRFISNVYGYPVPRELMEPIIHNAHALVDSTEENLRKQLPQTISYHKSVGVGHPLQIIREICASVHPDAIVLAAHGGKQFLMQSVSREVARQVPCTVVVLNLKAIDAKELDANRTCALSAS
jgi:nucleotide-binding universal stress UspA family protein